MGFSVRAAAALVASLAASCTLRAGPSESNRQDAGSAIEASDGGGQAWQPWRLDVSVIGLGGGTIPQTIDTDNFAETIFDSDGNRYALVALTTVTISPGSAVRIVGSRPLVVLARTIVIDGLVDLSGGGVASSSDCYQSQPGLARAGGGGGGGQSAGGRGGDSPLEAPAASAPDRLRAGCSGLPGDGVSPGFGGLGGGGLQLVALDSLDIGSSAIIGGGGGGGGGGVSGIAGDSGGGGGGSGGMIVLDSPAISLAGILVSHGGGGGGGGGDNQNGAAGSNALAASGLGGGGGGNLGGVGGDGGYAFGDAVTPPFDGASAAGGGGGGGGGSVGFVLTNGALTLGAGAIISPPPLDPLDVTAR